MSASLESSRNNRRLTAHLTRMLLRCLPHSALTIHQLMEAALLAAHLVLHRAPLFRPLRRPPLQAEPL